MRKGAASNWRRQGRRWQEITLTRPTARCRFLLIGMFAASAFITGCAATIEEHAPQATHGQTSSVRNGPAHSIVADNAQAPSSEIRKQERFAAIMPRLKPKSAQKSDDLPPKLSMLLGLSNTSIIQLFGQPNFVERNGTSIIWNYETSTCLLQIVFYADIEDQTYHALQYALVDGDGEKPVDAHPCLDQIQSATHNDVQ